MNRFQKTENLGLPHKHDLRRQERDSYVQWVTESGLAIIAAKGKSEAGVERYSQFLELAGFKTGLRLSVGDGLGRSTDFCGAFFREPPFYMQIDHDSENDCLIISRGSSAKHQTEIVEELIYELGIIPGVISDKTLGEIENVIAPGFREMAENLEYWASTTGKSIAETFGANNYSNFLHIFKGYDPSEAVDIAREEFGIED